MELQRAIETYQFSGHQPSPFTVHLRWFHFLWNLTSNISPASPVPNYSYKVEEYYQMITHSQNQRLCCSFNNPISCPLLRASTSLVYYSISPAYTWWLWSAYVMLCRVLLFAIHTQSSSAWRRRRSRWETIMAKWGLRWIEKRRVSFTN